MIKRKRNTADAMIKIFGSGKVLQTVKKYYENKNNRCDYCGDKNVKTRSTPYMVDVPAKMCKHCWDIAKEQAIKAEEIWIGEFDDK